jgi:hypothetical protein
MLQAITKRLKRGKRGISTVIVVMLSLVLIVIIVGNVVLWSYQMNQVDMDRMQETLSLTNVERPRSPWFTAQNEFSINMGSWLSGSYTDTKSLGGLYETFREEPQGFDDFNPSSYIPVGSTSYVSGSIGDLNSDDGVYINFRSYSSTSQTDAFIAYRDNTTATLNIPEERTWTGANMTWSSQSDLPDSGSPVRWVRVAYCPLESRSYEKIVVTLSDDGYLDAYVWDGTSWNVANDIGYVNTTANAYKCFDVAYEKTSGEVLLVYAISSNNTAQDLAYKTWIFGTGWSPEYYIDDGGHATDIQYYWVELASNPTSGSNEITMVALDYTDTDGNGWVWNGSSWGSIYQLDGTVSIRTEECIAVAYESQSGTAWTAVGSGTNASTFSMRSQTGGIWNATKTNPNVGGTPNWCTLKSDPASNQLMLVSVDGNSDLNTVYYAGSGDWTVQAEHDPSVDTHAQRCADFAWEPTGSKGLLVWGTTAGEISYKTFTAPDTWGPQQNPTMGANVHPCVQLRTNTRSITGDALILGVVLEGTVFHLGAISWNGTAFTIIGTDTISTDTAVSTYECFEMEFRNFEPPTQFTCEVELSGTANAQNWTQLEWTADLAFTTPNVITTLQLYNFNVSQYPTAGDGCITEVIGQTDVTRNQTITTNPTYFRDSGNNWKIKITGTKMDTIPFELKIDWIRFKVAPSDVCRLDVNNNFTIDHATYPRSGICGIEIRIRYNVTGNGERWFLKVYNWATDTFTDTGFNNTAGDAPTPNAWNDYAINVTANWADYVRSDGVMRVEFSDEGLRTNQTIAEIDFLGTRAIMDGAYISIKDSSSLSVHIVALWITNSTSHQRYDADLFLNAGESTDYIRMDISLPQDAFITKIITERGNTAVFSSG